MNVLVITTSYTFPGAARPLAGRFFGVLVRHMREHGASCTVVCPTAYVPRLLSARLGRMLPKYERWEGVEIYRPRYLSLRLKRRLGWQARSFCLSAMPACQRLHRRRRFEAVVGYGFCMPAFTAAAVARRLGLPSASWAIGSSTP